MVRIPRPRIRAQKMLIPTTVRHEPEPSMLRVPIDIQSVKIANQ